MGRVFHLLSSALPLRASLALAAEPAANVTSLQASQHVGYLRELSGGAAAVNKGLSSNSGFVVTARALLHRAKRVDAYRAYLRMEREPLE